MTAAALGTELSLDTFDGQQEIDVKAGTQSGEVITLRGLGVTHLRGYGRGDLKVHLQVETPGQARRRRRRTCSGSSPSCAANSSPRASSPPAAASSPSCGTGSVTCSGEQPRSSSPPPERWTSRFPVPSFVLGRVPRPAMRSRSSGSSVGEAVDIADGAGKRLTGTVTAAAPGEPDRRVRPLTVEARPDVRLVLVQALAKGDRDELAIETATELGIDAVIPGRRNARSSGGRVSGPPRPMPNGSPWSRQPPSRRAAPGSRRSAPPSTTPGLQAAVAAADLAVILHEDAVRPLRAGAGGLASAGSPAEPPDGRTARDPADRGPGGRHQLPGSHQAVRRRCGHGAAGPSRAAVLHRRARPPSCSQATSWAAGSSRTAASQADTGSEADV